MHRHDKRKTAQPTPLFDYISIPLCRRCSDAPDCPLYHPRSDAPVTLPLRPCLDAILLFRCAAPFRSNPLHCSIAPLEGSSPPCRSGPVRTQARHPTNRFCSHILHCPAASLADHPLPPILPVWVQPRPPLCNSIRMHPTASLCRCCSQAAPVALPYRNRPAVASLFEYSPPLFHAVLLKGNSAAPPPFRYDIVFPAVRLASDAPYCTAMPPLRGNTLVTRPYPPFKGNPVARCPSLAGELPRRPAVPPHSGGTAGRRLLFARVIFRPKRPERVVFLFSVRPIFLWKLRRTTLSFFRMDNDSQATG